MKISSEVRFAITCIRKLRFLVQRIINKTIFYERFKFFCCSFFIDGNDFFYKMFVFRSKKKDRNFENISHKLSFLFSISCKKINYYTTKHLRSSKLPLIHTHWKKLLLSCPPPRYFRWKKIYEIKCFFIQTNL